MAPKALAHDLSEPRKRPEPSLPALPLGVRPQRDRIHVVALGLLNPLNQQAAEPARQLRGQKVREAAVAALLATDRPDTELHYKDWV